MRRLGWRRGGGSGSGGKEYKWRLKVKEWRVGGGGGGGVAEIVEDKNTEGKERRTKKVKGERNCGENLSGKR